MRSARETRTVLFTCPNLSQVGCGFQQDFSKTFFATLRPRLGVTMYRGMVYATGGLAVASWKTSDVLTTYGGPSAITAASTSQTAAGWTLGAGLEYALTDNWLLGLVYLYADLGKSSSTAPAVFGACCSEIGYTHRLTENLVRINLNYKFGNYAYAVPVRK